MQHTVTQTLRAWWNDIPTLWFRITYGYLFDIEEEVEAGEISRLERVFWGIGNWYVFTLVLVFFIIPRFLFRCVKRIWCIRYGHQWESKMLFFGAPFGMRDECSHCHTKRNQIGLRF